MKFMNIFWIISYSGVLSEFCPSYNDTYGDKQSAFYCPIKLQLFTANDHFCCGTNTSMYCCHDITKSIYSHAESKSTVFWNEYWPYFAVIGFALISALFSPFLFPPKKSVIMS
ncbi:uncharacterized protein [Haliotis cracherodii]|uniref:uncharacterized protein isoform X1 n=1 Tax=Haliotis cracherodii TaxID=6455 RepID=UPI0039E79C33